MLKKLWNQLRRQICPKRLYPYGTQGLFICDDRTPLEKVCDVIDEYFYQKRQEASWARHKATRVWCENWTDNLGNSHEVIKKHEAKGYAYATPREWDQVANNAKRRIDKEQHEKFRKKIEYAASEIKKGRKYTKEWNRPLEKLRGNA